MSLDRAYVRHFPTRLFVRSIKQPEGSLLTDWDDNGIVEMANYSGLMAMTTAFVIW